MKASNIASASTRFGFKLFLELLRKGKGWNILISPTSIAAALAMTYNGAMGDTKRGMEETLELQGMSFEEVNRENAALIAGLKEIDSVQINIANSLWGKKDVPFNPDFIQRNRDFYEAGVRNLDFSDPRSISIINAWVSEKTAGLIKKIVDEIDPLTILILINAIYFKGKWSNVFNKADTKEGLFTLLDGKQKNVHFMSQSGRYPYHRGRDFQAISLPYGDGRVSMYIFLPDKKVDFYGFLNNFNLDLLHQFSTEKGAIKLPRFKLEYSISLNDALKSLGMEVAFDEDKADFSGMCPVTSQDNVYIYKVVHKSFMEVNEEGTEAGAATKVEMNTRALLGPPPFNMVVDHPFFCVLRDNATDAILFMGAVVDPSVM
ncbi:MAG TPA: serpin family protein [Candidatus Methanoperedenaceae archaeon]|nr:serpin family protein [Candidatus Methanoperedenaceae archaeon]